ncbi:hypothetical protein V5O48_016332, partial [Marasmius crinis-equi]
MTQTAKPSQPDVNDDLYAHIPLQVRQNSLNWKDRARRTHSDPWKVKTFRQKDLPEQLEENYNIRQQNKRRRKQDEVYVTRAVGNEPGSPQASEWSISEDNWKLLECSTDAYVKVKDWLTVQKQVEIEDAHRAAAAPTAPPAPSGDSSKEKKSGVSLKAEKFVAVPRRPGIKATPPFHRSIFEWLNYHT